MADEALAVPIVPRPRDVQMTGGQPAELRAGCLIEVLQRSATDVSDSAMAATDEVRTWILERAGRALRPFPVRVDVVPGNPVATGRVGEVSGVADSLVAEEHAIAGEVSGATGSMVAGERSSSIGENPCVIVVELSGPVSATQVGPDADEAYEISVDGDITIRAATLAGAGHALSVLGQLGRSDTLGAAKLGATTGADRAASAGPASSTPAATSTRSGHESGQIPALEIRDEPAHRWRSLSVDVARNFVPIDVLHDVIDIAADLRLNVLHLHLTDDQGWRIDIPGLPELAAKSGATSTLDGGAGHLSVDQFKALDEFASRRGIVLVPEIDLPGHTHAALYALPQLRGASDSPDPYTGIEVGFSKLHHDNPATAPFIAQVIRELAAMTRGRWLHIGGDECHQMTDTEYAALVHDATTQVFAAGKIPVLWQEAARLDLDPRAWVTVWDLRSGLPAGVRAHAGRGGSVIAAPAPMAYLDSKYAPSDVIGQDWAGCATLRDAYDWRVGALLRDSDGPVSVCGVEAAIWTETIQGRADFMHMLLPRLEALAEVAWLGDEPRDVDEFLARQRRCQSR